MVELDIVVTNEMLTTLFNVMADRHAGRITLEEAAAQVGLKRERYRQLEIRARIDMTTNYKRIAEG